MKLQPLPDIGLPPGAVSLATIEVSQNLIKAAAAVEQVLAEAYERGCVESVEILHMFTGLMRDAARSRGAFAS